MVAESLSPNLRRIGDSQLKLRIQCARDPDCQSAGAVSVYDFGTVRSSSDCAVDKSTNGHKSTGLS